MRFLSRLIGAAALAVAVPAFAEPAYKASDIVDFFVKSADQGAARGLCIGTADECAAARPKPEGFDMLIQFELDSDRLTGQARDNLEEFAVALRDRRLAAAKFVVEGHTDASGAKAYNESLADRRARSVMSFLLEHGVSADRVTAVGMGERAPRARNIYDPVNRRVEMRIDLK